jgi:hypothetical protein
VQCPSTVFDSADFFKDVLKIMEKKSKWVKSMKETPLKVPIEDIKIQELIVSLDYCPNVLFMEHQDIIPSDQSFPWVEAAKDELEEPYGPLTENDIPEDDSLETLIKKLVSKVHTNDIKQKELLQLGQRIEDLESHIKQEVHFYLDDIKDQLRERRSSETIMKKQSQVIEDQSKKIGSLEQQLVEINQRVAANHSL